MQMFPLWQGEMQGSVLLRKNTRREKCQFVKLTKRIKTMQHELDGSNYVITIRIPLNFLDVVVSFA